MSFGSNNINKLEYAKIMEPKLYAYKNQDAVGFYAFDSKVRKIIQPKSTKGHLNTMLSEMEKLQAANKTNIAVPFMSAQINLQEGFSNCYIRFIG